MKNFKIGAREIGEGFPVYIVAEMSANHNRRIETALKLIDAAKAAGADAVKIQTFTADTITLDSDADCFRVKGTLWDGTTLHELYSKASMPWEWYPRLAEAAKSQGIGFFSTPFDESAVDFLEKMDAPAYKIASSELIDLPLIRRAASKGKPLLLSTGMATREEIGEAVDASAGCAGIALLKCTAAYPAEPREMNLLTIPDMAREFGAVTGLSDHSMTDEAAVAAVALGCKVIEKHLTLSRADNAVDTGFSLEPAGFRKMVDAVRATEAALGRVFYGSEGREAVSRMYRPSLFCIKDIAEGEPFTRDNVASIRPGNGLAPKFIDKVLGRRAKAGLKKGTPLGWEHIA
jgi:pseudaminic acid synthase